MHRGKRDRQLYCLSLLRDSRKRAGPPRGPVKSLSKATPAGTSAQDSTGLPGLAGNRVSGCRRVVRGWFRAGLYRCIGTKALLTSKYGRPSRPFRSQDIPRNLQIRLNTTEPSGLCHRVPQQKLISDEQVRRLLHGTWLLQLNLANTDGHLGQRLVRFELRARTLRSRSWLERELAISGCSVWQGWLEEPGGLASRRHEDYGRWATLLASSENPAKAELACLDMPMPG